MIQSVLKVIFSFLFIVLICWGPIVGKADPAIANPEDVDRLAEWTTALNRAEQERRELLTTLTALQLRVKKIATEKGKISGELLATEESIRLIALQVETLEQRKKKLKAAVLRRLRSAYRLQLDRLLANALFAKNSFELDGLMRGLKTVSQHDYRLLSEYSRSLVELADRRKRLDQNVKKLLLLEKRVQKQESMLVAEHKAKTEIATKVEALISTQQKKLAELKSTARQALELNASIEQTASLRHLRDLLKPGLFELKGRLKWPIRQAELKSAFGVIADSSEGLRLNHKGIELVSTASGSIQTVAEGRVVFRGPFVQDRYLLVIDHRDHYYSILVAAQPFRVEIDQLLKAGEIVGSVSSQQTVYFELRHFAEAQNPLHWLEPLSSSSDRSLVRGF